MSNCNYEEIKQMTEEQEAELRFDHFSNKDALALGNLMVERLYRENIELAVAIRRLNGSVIFQYMTDGTNGINQKWMERKFNTVNTFQRSSLGVWALQGISGETVEVHGLSTEKYVFVGGGFPVRLKTGELVAVVTVSNLDHLDDHAFIIDSITEYLKTL